MKISRLFPSVLLALSFLAGCCYADSSTPAVAATMPAPAASQTTGMDGAAEKSKPKFISPDSIDLKALLPDPPADDSAATKAEIEEMLRRQAAATPAELARAKSETTLSPFIFADVLGSKFNPDDLPKTAKFLHQIEKDSQAITAQGKLYWNRRRPFLNDSRINSHGDYPTNASYPSGHTTRAFAWASVLSAIFPDKKAELMARAQMVADDRVITGVHYPSDVAAGKILGLAIGEKLLQSPKLQADLIKIREELTAQGLPVHDAVGTP